MTAAEDLGMPELSIAESGLLDILCINIIMLGNGPTEPVTRGFAVNFVRQVAKAISEYKAARSALVGARNNMLAWAESFRAVSHLETCIGSVHRAILFARGLDKLTFADGSLLVPLDGDVSVLSDSMQDRIRRIRNAIEHMNEHLSEGKVSSGEPFAVFPDNGGVELEGKEVSYEELAKLIMELAGVAAKVADYKQP